MNKEKRKGFLKHLRAGLVCFALLTGICGIAYPIGVTIASQALFPYEANGSQIEITLKDGTKKVFGSELIGQNYEEPKYLFGRVNTGAPTNLSPESEEFKELLEKNIEIRKEKLKKIGYSDLDDIPDELITSSGSGVDPHISPKAAYFQVDVIAEARKDENITKKMIEDTIEKYTEGRFLGIFGEERVNVLLVNLSLDGLI